jgi:hypothetical protein
LTEWRQQTLEFRAKTAICHFKNICLTNINYLVVEIFLCSAKFIYYFLPWSRMVIANFVFMGSTFLVSLCFIWSECTSANFSILKTYFKEHILKSRCIVQHSFLKIFWRKFYDTYIIFLRGVLFLCIFHELGRGRGCRVGIEPGVAIQKPGDHFAALRHKYLSCTILTSLKIFKVFTTYLPRFSLHF